MAGAEAGTSLLDWLFRLLTTLIFKESNSKRFEFYLSAELRNNNVKRANTTFFLREQTTLVRRCKISSIFRFNVIELKIIAEIA